VTFIHPVGGYGFGIQGAEFVAENTEGGGNVLMLRILPGVDVLETRYSAGRRILEEAGLNIVGAEFTDGDNAKTKSIVEDYLQRGSIDAVWMDAGATAVAAVEAFEDGGYDVPVFVGEDQQDFLQKWEELGHDRDRADLPDLPVAHADHRGAPHPAGRGGAGSGVGAAAAGDHRREPRPSTSTPTCRRCTTPCAAVRRCRAIRRPGAASRAAVRGRRQLAPRAISSGVSVT
jgi:hypothetical protein